MIDAGESDRKGRETVLRGTLPNRSIKKAPIKGLFNISIRCWDENPWVRQNATALKIDPRLLLRKISLPWADCPLGETTS